MVTHTHHTHSGSVNVTTHYQEVGEMYKEKAMAGSSLHDMVKDMHAQYTQGMEDFFADTCTLDSK